MGKARKLCGPKPDVNAPSYSAKYNRVLAEPLVLVVVPARELALQTFDEARKLCYRSKLRPCVAYGGMPVGLCIEELGKGCDILIATPGRLVDLMNRSDVLSFGRLKWVQRY